MFLHFFQVLFFFNVKDSQRTMAMKSTIRCCISCILPCGALDVIRIVHSNGRVEEISGTIRASEIMKAYPKHVLKKPSSSSPSHDDGVPKIVTVAPDAELQRGKIYFLMPVPASTPQEKKTKTAAAETHNNQRSRTSSNGRRKRRENANNNNNGSNSISVTTNLATSDRYLSEILSEKVSTQRERRRGRVGVWRPHLDSISETSNDG